MYFSFNFTEINIFKTMIKKVSKFLIAIITVPMIFVGFFVCIFVVGFQIGWDLMEDLWQ